MPFPHIEYCVMCDVVRPELDGKATLLGFFGVTPYVTIGIRDLSAPTQLGFVLLSRDTGEGTYKIQLQILDPRNRPVIATEPQDHELQPGVRQLLMFQLTFPLATTGRYLLRFLVDGNNHFESSFEILRADQVTPA